MAAAFRFSAQLEQPKGCEDPKSKPPDPIFSTKRPRYDDSGESDKVRSVTYGRNGRYTGAGYAGSRYNSQTNNGKTGLGRKNGGAETTVVANNITQSRDLGRHSAIYSKKVMNNSGSRGNNITGATVGSGSRFAVLSEEKSDEAVGMSTRRRAEFRSKTPAKKVLAEVSNRKTNSMTYQSSGPSKYLINPPPSKPPFNKPCKENIIPRQGTKLPIKHIVIDPSVSVGEEIKDFEVLQSLHNDILQQAKRIDSDTTGNAVETQLPTQVNVSDATDFEMVASTLKEAMEVVLV
ncbi:hypothetical protein LWI29_012904 [Acer saccharum]|uniref:Uncharacterized protein n=1 Tax=Acer saccharum TaxID=4024 RepID=A0AA39VTD7_ACESA|nr:hypothetical protein LWI29_012904 [Acer saccharum]